MEQESVGSSGAHDLGCKNITGCWFKFQIEENSGLSFWKLEEVLGLSFVRFGVEGGLWSQFLRFERGLRS